MIHRNDSTLMFAGEEIVLKLAPAVGLEPTTLALTAPCSTIELHRSRQRKGTKLKESCLLSSPHVQPEQIFAVRLACLRKPG